MAYPKNGVHKPKMPLRELMALADQVHGAEAELARLKPILDSKSAQLMIECWHPITCQFERLEDYEYEPVGGHGMSTRTAQRKIIVCTLCQYQQGNPR